jgi:hypothetical protein
VVLLALRGMPAASRRLVPGMCSPYTIWSLQPWYAPPTLMTFFLPVKARAARMAAITPSVPDPSMRNISTFGMKRLISRASFSSYSWNSPVTGPQLCSRSITFSRTGA